MYILGWFGDFNRYYLYIHNCLYYRSNTRIQLVYSNINLSMIQSQPVTPITPLNNSDFDGVENESKSQTHLEITKKIPN